MFESVEVGAKVDKATFEKREAKLREALLEAQYGVLRAAQFPVVVLVNGVDGASKSETVSRLTEWMDPRHIHAHALAEPTDEERQRPPMWRFWRRLPRKGQTGVFFGSWYSQSILDRADRVLDKDAFALAQEENRRFEQMLVDEGALLLKFWFHLSKKDQKKRLEELSSDKRTAWRVTSEERRRFEHYDRFARISAKAIRATDTKSAPWTLVEGMDARHASLVVGEALLAAMKRRLATLAPEAPGGKRAATGAKANGAGRAKKTAAASPVPASASPKPLLRSIDLTKKLDDDEYEKELAKWQRDLALLTRKPAFSELSPVVVFEGLDAAGKGGAIRRITRALDPRVYDIVPIAAPSDEERAQPYLWRFWRHAPRDGKFVIFDRSWYGRVLVERVEGYCSPSDWQRAYGEINDFEAQLERAGNVVVKLWLQVSQVEQLRRFQERERVAWKQFKIGPDDWRNREKWPAYEVAASEMIERTSTDHAPWTLVAAEDKNYARIKVLRTLVEAIEDAL